MPRFNRMVVNGAISDRNIFRHSVFVQVKCLQATNTKKYLLLKPHRLPLRDVQNQWQRVIFMQTNREDLGNRYRLIEIPYTDDKIAAQNVSQCYRDYFLGLYELQRKFDHMSDDF